MPLKAGKAQSTLTANRRELWRAYREKGKIGRIKPRSRRHALEIINAIVYRKSRSS